MISKNKSKQNKNSSNNSNNKLKIWFKKFLRPNVFQFILIWYLLFVFIGAGLLMAPFSINWGKVTQENHYNFMSALFTATSAFSDTGLVVTPTDTTFKPFGQVVIFFLILVGGIGLIVVVLLVYKSFFPKRKLRFNTIVLLQSERGSETLNNTVRLIFSGVIFILVVNFICSIFLMFCFYYIPARLPEQVAGLKIYKDPYFLGFSHKFEPVYHNWVLAFWNALFDSVSSLDNAGFSLFGESSLSAYRNGIGISVQVILMLEWMIGGLGFPVIYETYQYFKSKFKKQPFKYSLFSKICVIGIFLVITTSTCLTYTFAYTGESAANPYSLINVKNYSPSGKLNTIYSPWGINPSVNKNWAIFWNCMSTRSAGFDSYNLNQDSESNKILYTILMYIGSSPSSTGGGIRITTFIIVMYALFVKIKGQEKVSIFKKQINPATVSDSFLVFLFAILLILISTFVVHFTFTGSYKSNLNSYVNDFFVVSSAFGTCGLSLGSLTNDLGWGGLLFLIITMFIGQLGVGTAILSVSRRRDKDKTYNWPIEDVRVG